jgi:hypothetical protein
MSNVRRLKRIAEVVIAMKPLPKVLLALALPAIALACVVAWLNVRPIYDVKQQVRANLKDPDSAKFDDVTWNPERKAGCGYVNAKNAMGGYAGSTHFVILNGGYLRFEPERRNSASIDDQLAIAQKRLEYAQLAAEYCKSDSRNTQ